MVGTVVPLLVLCTVFTHNYATARPQDYLPDDQNTVEHSQPIFYPPSVNYEHQSMPGDRPKGCFHFFVSRNMSSLLADATKMLRTIRDSREREWILTFIYRIKSLAEHLRSHPESRNYNCLPTADEESKKRILSNDIRGQQQPELYFVDEVIKRTSEGEVQQEERDNQEKSSTDQLPAGGPTKQENGGLGKESTNASPAETGSEMVASHVSVSSTESVPPRPEDQKTIAQTKKQKVLSRKEKAALELERLNTLNVSPEDAIVLSQVPDCNKKIKCPKVKRVSPPEESPEKYFSDAGDIYPMYQADNLSPEEIEAYEQERLKRRIRKALLEELAPEIKKLKTVGGTPEDLMNLWNSFTIPEEKRAEAVETDFDYEETGAAAGDLNLNERAQPDRTVAPSLDEVQNSKDVSNHMKEASYEPYDDSDVLVQQLFDVRFDDEQSKTTKSLNDQNSINNNNEYLITSTHTPF